MGAVVAALVASLALAHGSPQQITLVNQAGIPAAALQRAAAAITVQVNRDLRPWWRTPIVQVSTTGQGWPVYIKRSDLLGDPNANGEVLLGVHYLKAGVPAADVFTIWGDWTVSVSHEIIEMLTDPSGTGTEIVDPVSEYAYRIDGVRVSDFVLPAWYTTGVAFDMARRISRPGECSPAPTVCH